MATKQELIDQADALGLVVTKPGGGVPTAADYQHALDIAAGAVEPDPPTATEQTFEVVGPYPVLGHQPGATFTAVVQPDGVIYDDRGKVAAVTGPLLEAGAIRTPEEAPE